MALPGRSTAGLCAIASSLTCTEEPRGTSEPQAYPQNGSPAAPPPGSAMASEQKPKEPFFFRFTSCRDACSCSRDLCSSLN